MININNIYGHRLPWESKEQSVLKFLSNSIISIYSKTELDIDDLGAEDLRDLIRDISNKVEDINNVMQKEIDRLIVRDADLNKDKVCEDHQSDKIWKCSDCVDKMAKAMEIHSHPLGAGFAQKDIKQRNKNEE